MKNHNENVLGEKDETTTPKRQEQTINIEALALARELSGLTQTQLANQTGFSQAKISRYEDGIAQPTTEEVHVLAAKLNMPVRFFYRSDVRRCVFNSFYRKRKSVSQKILMQFNARVCIRQVQIDRLLDKTEFDSEPVPRFDPDEYQGGIKPVALALRQFLKLPPGPVRHLIRALEDKGIVVVLENFGITKIDGVSTFTNNGTPIIFLNLQAPPSRRRFSVAHEFAHTALHKYLAPDVDQQADALAAELLMPEDDIKPDLVGQPLTLGRLATLKLKWQVSMAAILFRAKTIGVVEQRRYSYLWTQMAAAGWRTAEPHEELLENEKPQLEREMIDVHLDDLHYSAAEIAESLDMTESTVLRRYRLAPSLSIV